MESINELINKDYYVAILSGEECSNLKTFMEKASEAFKFPDYYGANINAFLECINDLDWLPKSNYALIVKNSNTFMSDDTDANKQYVHDMLENISKEWANVPNYDGEDAFRKRSDFKVVYM